MKKKIKKYLIYEKNILIKILENKYYTEKK